MKNKLFGWNFSNWAIIAFYAICGLLLLLWPDLALTIANYVLASALCLVGGFMIVNYLRSGALERLMGYGLAKGLIFLLLGLILLINNNLLTEVLPFLWGLSMIFGGFGKLQMAFDVKRIQRGRWWWFLIGALISFVLGIFSVTKPAFLATVVTQFAGISLLVEAVLDVTALILIKREIKHLKVETTVE